MVDIMGNMSNLDMDNKNISIVYNSDDQLRECVNDLLVVIASMQEKIENLSDTIDAIEEQVNDLTTEIRG